MGGCVEVVLGGKRGGITAKESGGQSLDLGSRLGTWKDLEGTKSVVGPRDCRCCVVRVVLIKGPICWIWSGVEAPWGNDRRWDQQDSD
eukprot:CAMPEP_0184679376 /NCGR_PEP_ID=MMETSP0312-20130426/2215_1 /TAXON_ID=31354 /ORGANISM="Compsopogon coeruleus, Strain SAG 36.94" /LENGTH=87 /DNA_ID=CAMNT_0027128779 /DNA_START=118 /DNA_END=381 /DNA_ORIENTATION=+